MVAIPESVSYGAIPILFRTYPFYHDRPSRKAVRSCLQSLLLNETYPDALSLVLEAFAKETSKTSIAASNAFVLVEWASLLVQQFSIAEEQWKSHGADLVTQYASILETCVATKGKPNVRSSALVWTRRALRHLFLRNNGERRVQQIITQLTATSSPIGARGTVFLGVVAGVCARRSHLKSILGTQKGNYISFFLRELIGSRTTVPEHLADALGDFFSNYVTFEDLDEEIVPAVEKALLRSPEVVLNNLLSPMIDSLPQGLDVAPLLASRLVKPLLSNLKSSNAKIRDGAVSTFTNAISHSHDDVYLSKVADEVLTPLSSSKLAAAEHRVLHARILAGLPRLANLSEPICGALTAVAIKEPNESALSAELHALSHHLCLSIQTRSCSGASIKTFAENACKGMSDKKPANRRAWVLMVGDVIWQTKKHRDATEVRSFVEATLPKMLELFQEVTSNVIAATQSGLVVASFVLTALCTYIMGVVEGNKVHESLRKASVLEQACSSNAKLSFLIGHRVYSKLAAPEDLRWFIRALAACSSQISLTESNSVTGDAWAQAFLYAVTATSISYRSRNDAVKALHESYLEQPSHVACRVIKGLWSWQEHLATGQQDSAAAASKSDNSRLHFAVQAICPSKDEVQVNAQLTHAVFEDQLIRLLVICRQPLIPHISWIEICLGIGQDPGDLARSAGEQCLLEIRSCADAIVDKMYKAKVKTAASDAAAELAFVAPETVIPLLVEGIVQDLSAAAVCSCSPTDIAIARTPEGTTFVDVLSTKSKDHAIDKNTKDYDTLKWEAEVRSQLASKKGRERKLSADEKAKIDAQLKKEAAIRTSVRALEEKLRRGVGLISALTKGPPTDPGMWFRPCSKALLDVIAAGAGLLMGGDAEFAYLDLAKLIAPRLGSLQKFVGVATLRALGTTALPENMKQEPLGGMYEDFGRSNWD